ncbi:phosphotransferase [Terasakiella sp. SH-1]|uniref:phosphotransferase n=1 Tax=Terasakiella sp. SH-1 TaxID=2560057 RepID=UPI001073A1CF|nr:phosphotransferase [Terasakiella sp. SH-1]
MRLPQSVLENLHFLLAETQSQLANLRVLLETASPTVSQRILDRQGYSYNLAMRVHDGCIDALRHGKKGDVNIFSLRAAEAIASDLERITDICHDCVKMMGNLSRKDALRGRKSAKLLSDIDQGIELIEKAIETDDTRIALKIGNIERKLDIAYGRLFKEHIKEVRKKKRPEDTITSLFIAHHIEEMGDMLLSISESIMSAKLGQPMHIDRFRSLKTALSDLGLIDGEVETIAETKSGSAIAGITDPEADEDGYVAIFKDGKKEKLKEERESVESWHEIFPGLAPQILSYEKRGKNAALLIEHLPGDTYERILLQEDEAVMHKALKHLCKTLKAVWQETKKKKQIPANHMAQLKKRLRNVLDVHPGFDVQPVNISSKKLPSLYELIETAQQIEDQTTPPFSVYIHGDFNLDNIIFDAENKKIRFIDLHRSCYQDYTQDISVFMVSNYRLQVLDKRTRQRIKASALYLYEFAKEYADKHKDKSFEMRMALGLARSFITSTRFILDKELATAMLLRGIYILERIAQHKDKDIKSFHLPIKDLFS